MPSFAHFHVHAAVATISLPVLLVHVVACLAAGLILACRSRMRAQNIGPCRPAFPSPAPRRERARVALRGRLVSSTGSSSAQRSYLTDPYCSGAAVMANYSGDASMGPSDLFRGAPASQQPQLQDAEPPLRLSAVGSATALQPLSMTIANGAGPAPVST